MGCKEGGAWQAEVSEEMDREKVLVNDFLKRKKEKSLVFLEIAAKSSYHFVQIVPTM